MYDREKWQDRDRDIRAGGTIWWWWWLLLLSDLRVSLKENEKKDKYTGLARVLKNMVTVIPIVIGALGTVTKGLIQGLEDLKTGRDHLKYSIFKIG